MRKPDFCICENKGADQLCGDRTTDQRLCFRYIDSTIPLLSKSRNFKIFCDCTVCVGPGRKSRRPVFSQRDSYCLHAHKVKTATRMKSITSNIENYNVRTPLEWPVIH